MANKPKFKSLTPKQLGDLIAELRSFLRAHCPDVKTLEFDNFFAGKVTLHRRENLGPAGYKDVVEVFDSVDEVKKAYGNTKLGKPVARIVDAARRLARKGSARAKKPVAQPKPKA